MSKFLTSDMYFAVLKKHVLEQSLTALADFTSTTLADEMIAQINSVVYEAYSGTYERREMDGGLSDRENINIVDVNLTGNSLTVAIRNTTKGSVDNAGRFIDVIVVQGIGYTWERSRIYKQEKAGNPLERDFYTPTYEMIEKILKDEFKKRMLKSGIKLDG